MYATWTTMEQRREYPREGRREQGVALLVTMLVLALLGMVGLASMETVTKDRQVAGYQGRSRVALYAAEAGVATALGIIRRDTQGLVDGGNAALVNFNPNFPDSANKQPLGTDSNPPTYYADPGAAKPIRYMGVGDPCWAGETGGVMSQEAGSIQWRDALWDVRVTGEANGGTAILVQSTATNCHPYN